MDRIDITLKREGAPPISFTFTDSAPDAARERLEFLIFVLRPFTGSDPKRVEKPPVKTVVPRSTSPAGETK